MEKEGIDVGSADKCEHCGQPYFGHKSVVIGDRIFCDETRDSDTANVVDRIKRSNRSGRLIDDLNYEEKE